MNQKIEKVNEFFFKLHLSTYLTLHGDIWEMLTADDLFWSNCFLPIYYMTNSYRPGLKKFDWFQAGL